MVQHIVRTGKRERRISHGVGRGEADIISLHCLLFIYIFIYFI